MPRIVLQTATPGVLPGVIFTSVILSHLVPVVYTRSDFRIVTKETMKPTPTPRPSATATICG